MCEEELRKLTVVANHFRSSLSYFVEGKYSEDEPCWRVEERLQEVIEGVIGYLDRTQNSVSFEEGSAIVSLSLGEGSGTFFAEIHQATPETGVSGDLAPHPLFRQRKAPTMFQV